MNLLHVDAVSRSEGGDLVVKEISFVQEPMQNLAVSGATGSGKTTLLKMIAGLVQPDAGEVRFEGARVKGPNEKLLPGDPRIGYVSQHFELRSHYRVEELLDMANRLPEGEAQLIYEVCRIDHLLGRWSHQLSGGEKQRIALARVLVSAPKLLLLDEPFSNLDVIHKTILKNVLHDVDEQLNISSILVAHDPLDVLSWADEIIVLKNGVIVQKDAAEEIYRKPLNEYTAGLFGKYNLVTPALLNLFPNAAERNTIVIRPEDFVIADNAAGVQGRVTKVYFLGSHFEVHIAFEQTEVIVLHRHSFCVGEKVAVVLRERIG